MAQTTSVKVPGLGEIIGLHNEITRVSRFLGIPYANVPARWKRATLVDQLPDGHHDGTRYGPICPQVVLPKSLSQMAIPSYHADLVDRQDEFECLNLNITTPGDAGKKLPVMVWIHGGAFALGASTPDVFDGLEVVTTSVKLGKPVVHVSMNYRIGFFGFIASEQLLKETGGKSVGNYGLWDQTLAFEFVRKHISAFGGDPANVTIYGESAGGGSIRPCAFAGKRELFKQGICQSGVTRTLGPVQIDHPHMGGLYDALAKEVGFDASVLPDDLRKVPQEKIIEANKILSGGLLLLVCFILDDTDYDDSFFPHDTDWVSIAPFCRKFMIGDCAVEGIASAPAMMVKTEAELKKLLFLDNKLPPPFLAIFGITAPGDLEQDMKKLLPSLIEMQSAVTFQGPTNAVIDHAPAEKTYVFRMDRPNLWGKTKPGPGFSPFAGYAHHTIDLLYLSGAPKRFHTSEPEKDIAITEAMVGQWVTFANDEDPWSPLSKGVEMVYGKDGTIGEVDREKTPTRDFETLRFVHEHPKSMLAVDMALSNGTIPFRYRTRA